MAARGIFKSVVVLVLGGSSAVALGGVEFAPYVSIRSTKAIKTDPKNKANEDQSVVERREAGLRAGLTFFNLFSLQLSAGQSTATTTQSVAVAKDEYGQIDYKKDLNMNTSDQNATIKTVETQRNGRLVAKLDPSFSIFILRAQAGVVATQRLLHVEQQGLAPTDKVFGPTYKPTSGFGFGIRFSPTMYCMAEYNMYHYAFPKIQPFEREVAVSYALSM